MHSFYKKTYNGKRTAVPIPFFFGCFAVLPPFLNWLGFDFAVHSSQLHLPAVRLSSGCSSSKDSSKLLATFNSTLIKRKKVGNTVHWGCFVIPNLVARRNTLLQVQMQLPYGHKGEEKIANITMRFVAHVFLHLPCASCYTYLRGTEVVPRYLGLETQVKLSGPTFT